MGQEKMKVASLSLEDLRCIYIYFFVLLVYGLLKPKACMEIFETCIENFYVCIYFFSK